MKTRKEKAELLHYWANQHEAAAEETLKTLEYYDEDGRNTLCEQLAHLVDDTDFLRAHAINVRTNPRYDYYG
jgi:hypothetical protein